jgi:predicted transcriptional regulator of viral defense system
MVTSRTDRLLSLYELAATQAGHFTAAQARALGYSARALAHHADRRHIERISRGFYRLAGVPGSPHDDVVAAWVRLAGRGAVVSHETALVLYELAEPRTREIHLTVSRTNRPRSAQAAAGACIHTTAVPLRADEIATRFGVRITSPARTIADVADAGGDPSVVTEAAARALATGLVSAAEIQAAARHRSARVRALLEGAVREAGSRA